MRPFTRTLCVLTALTIASLACGVSINAPESGIVIGPTVNESIQVPGLAPGETAVLNINFGAGELIISPGADSGLVTGTATFNVEEFRPTLTVTGKEFTLEQEGFRYNLGGLPNFDDLENTWDLLLADAHLSLKINAGAFDGNFDLGGLRLEEVRLYTGAASLDVDFSSPNLVEMTELRVSTGASDVEFRNLGNANFTSLHFDGGAGNFVLDFSGDLKRDSDVIINAALSNITLVVPAGVPAQVTVNGAMSNVSLGGTWQQLDEFTYSQPGTGPVLRITVDMGAGNLQLGN
ncbi:MAG: hypothetical protein EPO32_00500 [Anaerolineae bacterium]|nr:MAG: hypothetical protein EPO32_00500 [Anaerolineae bacterium]